MSNFSGAIKLADLNDFIAPSQACVVKLEDLKDKPLPQDLQVLITLTTHVLLLPYGLVKDNSTKLDCHEMRAARPMIGDTSTAKILEIHIPGVRCLNC